jgi:outer membrane protein assembly factor BamB
MRRLLAGLIAALAASLPAAAGMSAPAAWPQFRFDAAHSGLNPGERTLDPTNVARLREAWRAQVGGVVATGPAVVGGRLYVGSENRRVHAFDTATGRRIWSAPVPGTPSSSAVVGGRVFVVVDDGAIYALAATNGRRLWSVSISSLEGGGIPSAPTVVGDIVYAMAYGVTALRASDGRILWRRSIDCWGCPVAVANRTVYVGAFNYGRSDDEPYLLYALDAATGRPRWSRPLGGTAMWTPAVIGGSIYLVAQSERAGIKTYRLHAFDRRSRRLRWTAPLGRAGFLFTSAAAVAGGLVVASSPDGALNAFRVRTGRRVWRATLPVTESAPAIAHGVVYVGARDGRLYAFARATGKRLWRARVGAKAVTSSPAVVNGTVYVGSDDGNVVAFRRR